LSATVPDANYNESGRWSIETGSSQARFGENNVDLTSYQPRVTGLMHGENEFVWTIIRNLDKDDDPDYVRSEHCKSTASVIVWYNGVVPNIPLEQDETCTGDITLKAEALTAYGPDAKGWWTANSDVIVSEGDPATTKTVAKGGTIATTNNVNIVGLTGNVTFYWNVENKSDVNSDGQYTDNEKCGPYKDQIIINKKESDAGNDATIVVCNADNEIDGGENTRTVLTASSTLSGTGAKGKWTCIMAHSSTAEADLSPYNQKNGYIVSPESETTVVNGLGQVGTYQFKWTVTNGEDCWDEAVFTVNNNTFKIDAYTPNPDNSFAYCGTRPQMRATSVEGMDPNAGDWSRWTVLNDGATIDADQQSLADAIVNLRDNATAVLQWTIHKSGCEYSSNVTVRDVSVHAYATSPVQTCTGSGNLKAIDVLNDDAEFHWEKIDPNSKITIANSGLATTAFSGMNDNSSVRVKWVVKSTNESLAEECVSEKEVLIVNNGYTNNIQAGEDAQVCDADGYQLSATAPTGYEGVWVADNTNVTFGAPTSTDKTGSKKYNVDETAKTFNDGTCDGNSKVYGLGVGANVLTWYIRNVIPENLAENDATNFQCINKKQITITNGKLTEASTTITAAAEVCSPSVLLKYTLPTVKGVNIEGHWESDKAAVKFYDYNNTATECSTCGNVYARTLVQGENKFWFTVHVVGAPDDCVVKTEEKSVINNSVAVEGPQTVEVCGDVILERTDPATDYPGAHGWWTSTQPTTMAAADAQKPFNIKVTSTSAGIEYVWHVNKGGDKLTDVDVNGQHRYSTNKGCNASQTFKVVNNKIEASISSFTKANNQIYAITDAYKTNGIRICEGKITLEANSVKSMDANGVWTLEEWPNSVIPSTSVVFSAVDESPNKLVVTDMPAAGTYKFKWTVTKGTENPCVSTAEIEVHVNSVLADADDGRTEKYYNDCQASYTLNPNLPSGAKGTWTISGSGSGKFADDLFFLYVF
jgi:hypothetical protein